MTDVEEIAGLEFFATGEDLVAVIPRRACRGLSRGRRRVFGRWLQALLRVGREVDDVAVDQAVDAVAHAVDRFDGAVFDEFFAEGEDDAGEALVDDGGWAAGLSDDGVAADEVALHGASPVRK